MVIKIHTVSGRSFKGLSKYINHDKQSETNERIGWRETHNLGTDDPEMTWRIMAATAMNHRQLKKAAGIGLGGRKPGGAVMHVTLSWSDEEVQDRKLTPDEEKQAAYNVLQHLGATTKKRSQYAIEHQVEMVSHTDTGHSHVHLMINRTHPEHGVYLPTSNNFRPPELYNQ